MSKATGQEGMTLRELNRSLPMELLKAREAAMSRFRPMLRANGLTEQQWRVIRVLADIESPDTTELAERSFLLAPSLSRILHTLEANNLINRCVDSSDSRRSFFSLAPKGKKIFRDIAPRSEALYDEIEREFGTKRLEALYGLLAEFYVILDSRTAE